MTGVHDTEIAKALRQVTPGDAGAVAVKHRIHEQSIVSRSSSGLSGLTWQQAFNALPVFIAQGISFGHAKLHGFWSFAFKSKGELIDDKP